MANSCVAEPAVVTDPDLLALEFEAIVAANYPPSAGHERRCPAVKRRGATVWVERLRGTPRTPRVAVHEPRIADRRPPARQRSPPTRAAAPSISGKEATSRPSS